MKLDEIWFTGVFDVAKSNDDLIVSIMRPYQCKAILMEKLGLETHH